MLATFQTDQNIKLSNFIKEKNHMENLLWLNMYPQKINKKQYRSNNGNKLLTCNLPHSKFSLLCLQKRANPNHHSCHNLWVYVAVTLYIKVCLVSDTCQGQTFTCLTPNTCYIQISFIFKLL